VLGRTVQSPWAEQAFSEEYFGLEINEPAVA
jgi:hypothetical protein